MFRQYRLRNYSFPLIAAVIALSVIGIMIIGSAQQSSQSRQTFGLIIGVVVMLILSLIDYGTYTRMRWIIYLTGCVLLVLVLLIGNTVGGATRWIEIGIRFQPSDLMKLCMIVFFAGYFNQYDSQLNTPKIILGSLAILAVPLFLIYKEPDLSTTIVTALVFCAIIFAAGLSWKIIFAILAVAVPGAAIFLSLVLSPDQTLIADYQRERILSWLRPGEYSVAAYQQQNSIIAIGSGQLYGKGLNNMELFIALMCFRIGLRAREKEGMLICIGVGSLVMFQSSLNIGVTTGLMPNTGITLPFVSYGVTSLVTFCMEIGIVLNVGLQPKRPPAVPETGQAAFRFRNGTYIS